MRFVIKATTDDLAKDYEKVLKPFNYQIEEKKGWHGIEYSVATVEINSLVEMLKLKNTVNRDIIISKDKYKGIEIEIYDSYRE